MRINSDFNQRVVVTPNNFHWRSSPVVGVERLMLDRIGSERGRATSVVRYAPYTKFNEHTHFGGEEFFVLEGSFHDDDGDYTKGDYVRNPIGTRHAPWAGKEGTTIFVKLHQFDVDDSSRLVVNTYEKIVEAKALNRPFELSLYRFKNTVTKIVTMPPNEKFCLIHDGVSEFLVFSGEIRDQASKYPAISWIRNPRMYNQTFKSGSVGAVFYLKLSGSNV